MSKDLNLCQFIGRLGKDPIVRHTADGKAVTSFSIGCGDDYKKKTGDKVEQTNWVNMVVWDRLGEICGEYLKKGSQVYISGKQVTKKYQAQDGTDRYTTEIVVRDMQMLDRNQQSDHPGQGDQPSQHLKPQSINQPAQHAGGFDDYEDTEIPF